MSLVLQSSGGGQITIQEPATASNFTQNLPAATGTVALYADPQVTIYSSGSGTYTVPSGAKYLIVEMVGGGGGGGGGGAASWGAGTNGGNSTFGSITCNGGVGAPVPWGTGGTGGSYTVSTGNIITQAVGQNGGYSSFTSNPPAYSTGSGFGGSNPLGFGGNGANYVGGSSGGGYGAGGGGGGSGSDGAIRYNGGGGGSAGYVKVLINSPASTYSYAVGAGGTGGAAGTGGNAAGGSNGGGGYIAVISFFG